MKQKPRLSVARMGLGPHAVKGMAGGVNRQDVHNHKSIEPHKRPTGNVGTKPVAILKAKNNPRPVIERQIAKKGNKERVGQLRGR